MYTSLHLTHKSSTKKKKLKKPTLGFYKVQSNATANVAPKKKIPASRQADRDREIERDRNNATCIMYKFGDI